MTKAEVIKQISSTTGLESDDVRSTVEAFFNVVKRAMIHGEAIHIRGFGSFTNKKRARKIARNITHNTAIVVEPYYQPTFKPAKGFVEEVREKVAVS